MERKVKDDEGNTKREYAIRFCHISNETPYDKRDMLYPNHFTEMDIVQLYASKLNSSKFFLKELKVPISFYRATLSCGWKARESIPSFIR